MEPKWLCPVARTCAPEQSPPASAASTPRGGSQEVQKGGEKGQQDRGNVPSVLPPPSANPWGDVVEVATSGGDVSSAPAASSSSSQPAGRPTPSSGAPNTGKGASEAFTRDPPTDDQRAVFFLDIDTAEQLRNSKVDFHIP